MKLSQLIKSLPDSKVTGDVSAEIKDISSDSRKITKGTLFVAIEGLTVDGHNFINSAIERGAVAIVGTKNLSAKVPYIRVKDSRRALGLLASSFYNNPSSKLKVVGVTGTDGKTTTSNIIYWIFSKALKQVGVVSTVNAIIGNKKQDTGLHVTNPEAVELQKLLHKMVETSLKYAVLEVTSHGLDQGRVAGVKFDCAVLTNITHEHMDYHKTMEDYRNAKAQLFRIAPVAVLNKDDNAYSYITKKLPRGARLYSYSIQQNADFVGSEITLLDDGMTFCVLNNDKEYLIKTNLMGDYNVSNILAAIAVVRHYHISWNIIIEALKTFKAPAGRMEKYISPKGVTVYNDFAHTPNALERVLKLFALKRTGRVIVLTGGEGERDHEKRAMMGEIATKYADIAIFTAIDPRSEHIEDINAQIEKGAKKHGAKGKKYFLISERGEAISFAINKLAQKGDTVIVCGKGHEKSMAYGKKEYPWSDREAIEIAFKGGVKKIKRNED